jgi:hemoglobin
MNEPETTFYEQIGGSDFFTTLVDHFYAGVAADPVLAAMYPADDMEGAKWRLNMFLQQYWGGPTTYSDERGHPRLRMRHNPFVIDEDARERWIACMKKAVLAMNPEPALRDELWTYLVGTAFAMQNSD